MSVALTDSIDLSREAARGRRIVQTVSLAQRPRLVEAFGTDEQKEAALQCELELSRTDDGTVWVRGHAQTVARLVCQRCLGAMDHPLDLALRWRSGALPDGDFELDGEPVRLIDWVEDDVLLALPSFPKHADEAQCAEVTQSYMTGKEGSEASASMRTPFANLKDLLEAGGKD